MVLPANQTVQVMPACAVGGGQRRISIRFQNQGPGNIWLKQWPFDSVTGAIKVTVNGIISDVPPGPVWQGEWYGQADAAATVLMIDEVCQ